MAQIRLKIKELLDRIKLLFSNHPKVFWSLLILFAILGGIFFPAVASAWSVKGIVFQILAWICLVIMNVLGIFLTLADWVLGFILHRGLNIQTQMPVDEGWRIVRDVANMFFVIFLLIIAFATILRIEAYQYKALLPKLILGILLVNFSRTICTVFIEFSNVLTGAFLRFGQGGKVSASIIFAMLGVDSVYEVSRDVNREFINSDMNFSMLLAVIFITFNIALLTVAVAGLAGLMITRTVALMVLVVLSPLAFVLGVLPVTKTYFSKWWETFMKYIFYAPIAAFLLYLATRTAQLFQEKGGGSLWSMDELTPGKGASPENAVLAISKATEYDVVLQVGLITGLLLAAIMMIREGGGMLADLFMKGAKFGMLGAGALAGGWLRRRMIKSGSGRLGNFAKGLARQTGWKKYVGKGLQGLMAVPRGIGLATTLPAAYKARAARLQAEVVAPAAARAEDWLDNWLGMGEKRHHADQVERALVSKHIHEQDAKSSAEQQREFLHAAKANDVHGMEAAVFSAAQHDNLNDFLSNPKIWNRYRKQFLADGVITDKQLDDPHFSPEIVKSFIKAAFGDKRGLRIASNIQEIAPEAGVYSLFGMVSNDKDGELKWTTKDEQRNIIWDKQRKMEAGNYWRRGHINAFREETAGDIRDFHEEGWEQLEHLDRGRIREISRMRGDIVAGLIKETTYKGKKMSGTAAMRERAKEMTGSERMGQLEATIARLTRDLNNLDQQIKAAQARGDTRSASLLTRQRNTEVFPQLNIAQEEHRTVSKRAALLTEFANKLEIHAGGGVTEEEAPAA
jgi:hypothetical protein